jgi:hypothetical protein
VKSWELQQAIYTRLTGYTALMAIAKAVFDDVPQDIADTSFPYVQIGDDTTIPFNTHSSVGGEHTITIHSWSRYRGKSEIKRIQAQIYAALDRYALSVSGGTMVNCEQEFSTSFLDADGITRHGISRYRVILDG